MIRIKPVHVRFHQKSELGRALSYWRDLICSVTSRPTHCQELICGEADYIGLLDASGVDGAGGTLHGGASELKPTVWRVEWPPDIKSRLLTEHNPSGDITNSDLEMVAFLLGWLVLEGLVVCLKLNHIGIGSDNTPTVSWTTKFASRSSKVSGCLVRVLSLCIRECKTAPLSLHHIAGIKNLLGEVPSRLFGYKKDWHFTCGKQFLTFFNNSFPLPKQQCWRICQLSQKTVFSVLT